MNCLKANHIHSFLTRCASKFNTPCISPLIKWGLLLFILLVRCADIAQRHELHPDEVYSVLLSQCNTAYYHKIDEGSYSGKQLKDFLTVSHTLPSDLSKLYFDNADAPHASLYYMLLRVCLQGFDNWNPNEVALRGGILNMVLLVVAYLLLWRLVQVIWCRNKPTLICAACCAMAFLSPGAADCAMLVREYQLAVVAILWYTLAITLLFKQTATNCKYLLYCTNLALATALALSSGYLNSFFLLLCPILIIPLVWHKYGKQAIWSFLRKVIIASLIALALAWAVYNGWFYFLIRKNAHTTKAFGDISAAFTSGLWRDIICNAFTLPFAIALLIAGLLSIIIYRQRCIKNINFLHRFKSSLPLTFIIAASLTIMLVQYSSLLHQSRYSFPFMPILSLAIPLCINSFRQEWLHRLLYISSIIYFCIIGYFQQPCRNFNWSAQRKVLHNGAMLHKLNPNEAVILYPALNDTAQYIMVTTDSFPKLSNDGIPIWQQQVTLTHDAPKTAPDSTHFIKFNGPVKAVVPN